MLSKMQRALFARTGAVTQEGKASAGGAMLDAVLDRAARSDRPDTGDWLGEADWARLQQEPLRARGLLWEPAWSSSCCWCGLPLPNSTRSPAARRG